MAQTKADRQAAAKKAAATRQRNAQKTRSQASGHKAASTRQARAAKTSANEARNALGSIAGSVLDGVTSAVKAAGTAAREGGKAVATRAGAAEIEKR
jgi:hypothetical protein